MANLKTELYKGDDIWTLKLIGRVNINTAHLMWNSDSNITTFLKKLTQANVHSLVIDLGQTETVDSHGLRALIDARKQCVANDIQVTLKNPNPHLSRLFRIMQFDRIFMVEYQ